jgi:hypothetical protein
MSAIFSIFLAVVVSWSPRKWHNFCPHRMISISQLDGRSNATWWTWKMIRGFCEAVNIKERANKDGEIKKESEDEGGKSRVHVYLSSNIAKSTEESPDHMYIHHRSLKRPSTSRDSHDPSTCYSHDTTNVFLTWHSCITYIHHRTLQSPPKKVQTICIFIIDRWKDQVPPETLMTHLRFIHTTPRTCFWRDTLACTTLV